MRRLLLVLGLMACNDPAGVGRYDLRLCLADVAAVLDGTTYATYDTSANQAQLVLHGTDVEGSAFVDGQWWLRSASQYGTHVFPTVYYPLAGRYTIWSPDSVRLTLIDQVYGRPHWSSDLLYRQRAGGLDGVYRDGADWIRASFRACA